MQAFIDFLLQVWRDLLCFKIIAPWEEGLRVRFGKRYRAFGPGVHFKLPFFDQFHVMNVRRQTVDLEDQTVETKDGVPVLVSLSLQYEIRNVANVFVKVQDFDVSLLTEAMNIVAAWINTHLYEECTIERVVRDNYEPIRKIGFEWGCTVLRLSVNNLARHRVYRLVTTPSVAGYYSKKQT